MVRRARVDAELVRRGLARSREHATELVAAGRVLINGTVATKPATAVEAGTPVRVTETSDEQQWASRGAHKLLGAFAAFEPHGLQISGRRCLDAGASTGGFTDVLLQRGAREVVAVDVGYGQLVWRLQSDDRVHVLDRTNARGLDAEAVGGAVDLVVGDLSFISLRLVLAALTACTTPGAVGRDRVGTGGVVRDPQLRAGAVLDVATTAAGLGLSTRGAVASPLPGPSGNVEFFLWLHHDPAAAAAQDHEEVRSMISTAVQEGPQ